jgi:predicted permease
MLETVGMIELAHNLIQDFRFGIRLIRRSRLVALGVVISLGLGIGATASVFSFLDFFLFRPLPVPEANRVVRLRNSTPGQAVRFSYPEARDYAERSQSFSGIATYELTFVGLAPKSGDPPRITLAMLVSGNFFSMLQLKPAAGRGFLSEEDSVPGRDAVAVISYAEWKRDFGGARDVVGRTVGISGHTFTIVGVAPEGFVGMDPVIEPGIYLPRMMMQQADASLEISNLTNRSSQRSINLVARLKPAVAITQAQADIERLSKQLETEYPETNKDTRASVLTQVSYRLAQNRDGGKMGVLLFGVAFLVLGIACVNVSNLFLSTVPARMREMAVRAAMGAPRRRLLQQLLIESVILSVAGSFVGLLIASWFADFLSSLRIGSDLPLGFEARVDGRVVIFALAFGLIAAFISGLVPAWRCSRNDLNSLLKSSDPRNGPRKIWGRQILVAAQVAVTALLLVISALHLKDLQIAATRNPGFRLEHVLTMALNPSMAGFNRDKSRDFYAELLERVRTLPGVRSSAIAQDKPFGVMDNPTTGVMIEGYELPANQQSIVIRSQDVGSRYFETLDIPIIRGRDFDSRDRAAKAPKTVIINEAMAQRFWPNRDPIGTHVDIKEEGGGPAEVIGIARNSTYASLEERSIPFLYRSYEQGDATVAVLLVETDVLPETVTSAIRTVVRNIAPNVPIFDVRTMEYHYRDFGLFELRLKAQIISTVGAVGLVLGILGLYGVIAYSVEQRTHEIGVRMAVGASDRQVLRMVLLQGLRSSGIAAVIGIGIALALSGVVQGSFAYVSAHDPVIYVAVLVLMLVVTGCACYIPARRASLVDPNITLRT